MKEVPKERARQATTVGRGRMRYVLAISTALAAVALAVILLVWVI